MEGREPSFISPARPSQAANANPLPPNAKEPAEVVEEDGRQAISVCIAGHVDVGKSTVLGHLLSKLGLIEQKVLHKLQKEATELGKTSFHYAFVLDTYSSERQRGVTMDVATHYFDTATKHVTILDCPGHEDLVPKVIVGASQADQPYS
jgi:elongation factor 1 alpha-like protein